MHYGSQLADELVHFGYPEFDEDFITDLKKEIPIAMELAKRDFDWESIEDSEQYHKRVLARARRERQKKWLVQATTLELLLQLHGLQIWTVLLRVALSRGKTILANVLVGFGYGGVHGTPSEIGEQTPQRLT